MDPWDLISRYSMMFWKYRSSPDDSLCLEMGIIRGCFEALKTVLFNDSMSRAEGQKCFIMLALQAI